MVLGTSVGSAVRSAVGVCKSGTKDFSCSTRRRHEAGVNYHKGACLGYWRHWVKLVLVLAGGMGPCWLLGCSSVGLNREGFNVLYLSGFAYPFPVILGHCFKRKWYYEQ